MLKVGIIGFGGRVSGMVRSLGVYKIPYRIAAIADPRAEELREKNADDPLFEGCEYFESADEMLDQAGPLDGIAIGTRCHLHTDMAIQAAERKCALFLEKPLAITFDQVQRLDAAFRDYPAPTVVSFPLRVSPIVEKIRELIDADTIGTVEHVDAWNDPPYASVYFNRWYRNFDEVGGLFLQKATHDVDYIRFLVGSAPRRVAAMKAQRVYGGMPNVLGREMPFELHCKDCEIQAECPESPFNLFYERFESKERLEHPDFKCMFSPDIKNEDLGHCLIEYESGAQACYTQNFFARLNAARRGARIYGYKGTIEFDWHDNKIRVHYHQRPVTETFDFTGKMPHFGGDRELCYDFLMAMRDGRPSRVPVEAGIESALTCLWARESAEQHTFCDVAMPD